MPCSRRCSSGLYSGVPQNPGGWLFRVARNGALDVLRRNAAFDARAHEITRELERSAGGDLDGAGPLGRDHRRRRAADGVHVLPSVAAARRARGAQPEDRRRLQRRGDRARIPGHRADDRATPGARQARPARAAHRTRSSPRLGSRRPHRIGARSHLSALQRRLQRARGRGPDPPGSLRRGAAARATGRALPAGPGSRRACARRADGVSSGAAAGARRCATARWCCSRIRTDRSGTGGWSRSASRTSIGAPRDR